MYLIVRVGHGVERTNSHRVLVQHVKVSTILQHKKKQQTIAITPTKTTANTEGQADESLPP